MLNYVGRMLYGVGSILALAIVLADLLLVVFDDEPHAPYSAIILIDYALIVWIVGGSAAAFYLGRSRHRPKAHERKRGGIRRGASIAYDILSMKIGAPVCRILTIVIGHPLLEALTLPSPEHKWHQYVGRRFGNRIGAAGVLARKTT